jgi:hypothetical protein
MVAFRGAVLGGGSVEVGGGGGVVGGRRRAARGSVDGAAVGDHAPQPTWVPL